MASDDLRIAASFLLRVTASHYDASPMASRSQVPSAVPDCRCNGRYRATCRNEVSSL